MNTTEIKDRITKMTRSERDDIRVFIDNLDLSDPHQPISSDLLEELDKRQEAVNKGTMKLHDAKAFINEWREKVKTI